MYYAQGQNLKALEYSEKVLSIYVKIFGIEHQKVSAAFETLAEICRSSLDFKNTYQLYMKAYTITVKLFGKHHQMSREIFRILDYYAKHKDKISIPEQSV